ncbi:MAG: PAS domain S-box protein, partial [Acidimicrobiia bacterium]
MTGGSVTNRAGATGDGPDPDASILDAYPLPTWIFDEETFFYLEVNDAAVATYGYSRDEFLAMTIYDVHPPDEHEDLGRTLAIERSVPERHGIGRHIKADGTAFDAEIISRAIRWRGRPARLVVGQDVSERANAARIAAALERRLSDVFDAITDGVMLIDDDWRDVFLNPAGEELIGELPEPLVGRRLWEAFPEMAGTSLQRRLVEAVRTGEPDRMEVYWAQGARWGEARMFPSAGQLMLYFRDITAERRAADDTATTIGRLNRLLAVSRAVTTEMTSLDELLDAMPRLVAQVLDAETALLFVADDELLWLRSSHGPVAEEGPLVLPRHDSFTGHAVDAGQVLSTPDLQIDERAAFRGMYDHHRAAMAAGIVTMRGPYGSVVVTDRRVGHFDEADAQSLGLIVDTLGAAIDRFESVDALRRSEERFRLLSEATTDAAYDRVIDRSSVWLSRGYEELFGWPSGDQPRALWSNAIHPDDRQEVLDEIERSLADPAVHVCEFEYRHAKASGGYASVIDRMFVLRDRDGRPLRVIGGIVDVTEEIEAE